MAFRQREIEPRRLGAFDKRRGFEFKNSALLLAFAFREIKKSVRPETGRE
jgi:hypothetical protein